MIHEQHVGWVSAARAAAVFGVLMGIAAAGAVRGQGVGAVPAQAVGWDQVPAILARIVPPAFPARDFPITAFGAAPGGEADSKPAMDRAIAACAEAGGGRVVVPAGEWLIRGPIHLKSHVNLHLAEGATVNFSTDPADFEPLVHTRFEGTELMNFSPLVYAYGQENIAVTGAGTLHGRAGPDNWWAWKGSDSNASTTEARRLGEIDMPVRERIFGRAYKLRPVMVQPYRCRNVLIEGVTLRDSPMWFMNPVLCTNVTVRNVSAVGYGPNNDGCNPEASRDVLIEGCFFDTGDDCIAIKSGRNADGRRIGVPSENIIIRDCTMHEGHGGVVMGSEMSGGVRNVFAENCRMDSPNLERALRIKSNSFRGGFVENVHFRNVTVGQVSDAVFRINLFYASDRGNYVPTVRNISMENVTVTKAPRAFYFHGLEQRPIRDVTIRDCRFDGIEQPSVMSGIENLNLRNLVINGQPKSN